MSRQYRSGYGYNSGGGFILCTGEGDGLNGGYATNDGSGSGFGSGTYEYEEGTGGELNWG